MIPIMKPSLPNFSAVSEKFQSILENGWITNGIYVESFEKAAAEYLGADHAVAVSSGTAALMGVVSCLGLTGEVITPSFTWCATAHALKWSGIEPVFVDIDPRSFNIDPECIKRHITSKTTAILAVHMFGNPCLNQELEAIADQYGIKLIYDGAHAFGSSVEGDRLGGWGDCTTYSLSPSKIITTGEGGLVATNDGNLAKKLKFFRNQGVDNYDAQFIGMNCRMTEFQAILGLELMPHIDSFVDAKLELLKTYLPLLKEIPGLDFQTVPSSVRSTFKDFNIIVNKDVFGVDRDILSQLLEEQGISTKKYYYPPVHRQVAYKNYFHQYDPKLQHTNFLSDNTLTLPLYPDMTVQEVHKVVKCIVNVHMEKKKTQKKTKASDIGLEG